MSPDVESSLPRTLSVLRAAVATGLCTGAQLACWTPETGAVDVCVGTRDRVGAAPIALEPVHENEPGHAAVQCIATRAAKTGTEAIIRWQIQRGAGVAVPVGDLDGAKVGSGVFKWAMSDNEKRGIDALGK